MEAARATGLLEHTLRARVRTGTLASYRYDKRTYVTLQDIAAWQPRRRSDRELYIREGHAAGMSDASMGRDLGISRERVRQIRSGLGLEANPPRPRLTKTFLTRQPITIMKIQEDGTT